MMEFNPIEIEKKSFEIISDSLGNKEFKKGTESIIKRVIHTTADFDYADTLFFSENALEAAFSALKNSANIVTDTQMAKAGINKKNISALNCSINCFIDSEEVATVAKEKNITRSAVAVEHAANILKDPVIFIIGNAPTALLKLYELITERQYKPSLVIGVPVGFVNVIEAKELIMELDVPHIISIGRKGGSNVAAAICNALLNGVINLC